MLQKNFRYSEKHLTKIVTFIGKELLQKYWQKKSSVCNEMLSKEL